MDNTSIPNTLSPIDHDLLIKLDTKMDGLSLNLKDFQTNLITRVSRTEARLDAEDIYHASIPLKDYDNAFHWVEGIRSNFNLLVSLGALLAATLGAIISTVITRWLHI